MTKSDLVRIISVNLEIPVAQADSAVNAFFDAISEGLTQSKRIELRGFGSFQVKSYDGYLGRNPKTGENVAVPPKVLPKFKAGKDAKNLLNG